MQEVPQLRHANQHKSCRNYTQCGTWTEQYKVKGLKQSEGFLCTHWLGAHQLPLWLSVASIFSTLSVA